MSKKFYLRNRGTGERFVPNERKFPVLYDSGYAAFVTSDGFYTSVTQADAKVWEVVFSEAWTRKLCAG